MSFSHPLHQGKEPFKPRYSVPKGLTSNTFSKRNENVVPDSDKDDKGISHHYIDNASTSGSSNGQTKPPKYNPNSPSEVNTSFSSSGNYVLNQGLKSAFKTPIMESYPGSNCMSSLPFPPSDFNSSSYLPASKAATTSPPKKRARATPKKRATRGKTLDISND
ncbi:uncharacterized protein MELLADRAFT_67905 [Melampsora larici-populina 98AG31]|uniref:Uncharacterized protein n=1 Tax=Melampsora larici-populina (strain 98AG31 / pathotype 3-4-7) TaxID=747676 RepID=F4S4W3_MELLP|nr:uncharacterized protein MELLADRAFT_67905 [Melampsora larici-populina 98AG31]EGG00314.1 hypothetical protein MELLADRAFT_67905 [Melampsora larici-populina 98AG31]